MSDLKQIVAIFNSTVTDNAIEDIKKKHDGLVHDFTNEEAFKAAKKVRAEMNKLLEKVDRVGIDSAKQVTDMRNELKERIESAYSGTITPFLIENQSRIDEAKRIKKEKESRIYEQTQKLALMKGASARALHLPIDDIEDILQDVMGIDIGSFDADMKDEAKAAKEISLAQLKDAFEFATQKEDMRKKQEIQAAELADKNDEIERMKAQIAEMTKQPEAEDKVEDSKINALMYSLTKDAARSSFSEYLENLNITEKDYIDIKNEWSKIGITKTYI